MKRSELIDCLTTINLLLNHYVHIIEKENDIVCCLNLSISTISERLNTLKKDGERNLLSHERISDFRGGKHIPSEVQKAVTYFRNAIALIVGFYPFNNVPQGSDLEKSSIELKSFVKENAIDYFDNKASSEILNAIRWMGKHKNIEYHLYEELRGVVAHLVAKDLLNHYKEFLIKYCVYGK